MSGAARFRLLASGLFLLLLFNGGMRTSGLLAFGALAAALCALERSDARASALERRLAAFGLWFAVSTLFASQPRVCLHQTALLAAGLASFRFASRAFDRASARAAVAPLLSACAAYLAAGVAHYLLAGESGLHFAKFGAKFFFTLGHYNHMGTLLLLLLPLPALAFARPAAALRATGALLLLLFLTGSRGAAGAALPVLLFLALVDRDGARRRVSPTLLAGCALAALLAASFVNPEIRAKFTTRLFDLRTADARGRDVIWTGAFELFLRHPLIGAGPGHYPVLAPEITRAQLLDAHNLFLNLLSETGLPGLLLFLFALASAFRPPPGGEGDAELARLLRLALAASLLQNLFASTLLLSGASAMLFFLLLGLLDASRRRAEPEPSPAAPRILPLPAALPLLGALLVLTVRLFSGELAAQSGLLAARAHDHALARSRYRVAVAADPAQSVVRLNHALELERTGRRGEAVAEFASLARSLPNCPLVLGNLLFLSLPPERERALLRERLRAIERTGFADLDEAWRKFNDATLRPSKDGPFGPLARALLENPRNIWSGFALGALHAPRFLDGLLAGFDLARFAAEAPYPHHLADAFALAGRLTAAVEIYVRAPLTAPAFAGGIREEDRTAGPGGVEKRLFELVAASGPLGGTHRGRFVDALRAWRDGGALEPSLLPAPRTAEDFLRAAWIALLRDRNEAEAAERLAEAWRIHARDYPAPVHFAFVTPLAPAPRILPEELSPAVPAWLDDNFLYFTTRMEPLPALAAAVRAGGQFDMELIRAFSRACAIARRIARAEGILR